MLDFMGRYFDTTGRMPALRDITREFECSPATTHYHLQRFIKQGVVKRIEVNVKHNCYVLVSYPTGYQVLRMWRLIQELAEGNDHVAEKARDILASPEPPPPSSKLIDILGGP
jgi:DNA-binding Lrp family transcriptional regulator